MRSGPGLTVKARPGGSGCPGTWLPGRALGSVDRLARDVQTTLLENPADLFQSRTGAALNVANGDSEPGGGIVSGQLLIEGTDDHLTVLAPERGQGGRHRPGVRFVTGR